MYRFLTPKIVFIVNKMFHNFHWKIVMLLVVVIPRHTKDHYFSTAEVYKRLGILCCLHIDAKNHPSLRATF